MKAHMKLDDPGKVPVTLSMTMPLEEWGKLRDQIQKGGSSYPGWQVMALIDKAYDALMSKVSDKDLDGVD